MRRMLSASIAALLVSVASSASDVYKVHVTRADQDLYQIVDGATGTLYIKTSFCYEFATWEEAVLILTSQPFQGSIAIGKIVFTGSWTTCQVDTVLSE